MADDTRRLLVNSLLFYLLILYSIALSNGVFTKNGVFTNSWAVEVTGGDAEAEEIAVRHGFTNLGRVGSLEGVYHFRHDSLPSRSARSEDHKHRSLVADEKVVHAEQQVVQRRDKREDYSPPHDQRWKQQWYLHRDSHHDMNVELAWELGITGKGVVVSILDDGIEHSHPDLRDSYDELASYDFNSHDSDPFPRYDSTNENKHGTRCAGEVVANKNGKCGVGAAYGAKIGGVRMLDGDVTDVVESSSLSLSPQHIHIYSSSWGPSDDGRTVDGPGRLAKRAFLDGVTKGRGGLGSIFVWAAGNGGRYKDSCSCDGYAISPYTISVGSASEHDGMPWYAEECPSTLAATYSSGANYEKQIVSTDLHHTCTMSHTGTSASAPLAAGILALALEANPRLTWRDVQYLVVYSSNSHYPTDPQWHTNAAGLRVSHRYGFGIMDATALVSRARSWTNVPPQENCTIEAKLDNKDSLPGSPLTVTIPASKCPLVYLEYAQAVTTLQMRAGYRSEVRITLASPAGTTSVLLPHRNSDRHREGLHQWPLLTAHSWGEDPRGDWKFVLETRGTGHASLSELTLVLFGTSQVSRSVRQVPEACHPECKGRCARPGPKYCDQCKHFRVASTLECVAKCPRGSYANLYMCRDCAPLCDECKGAGSCAQCREGAVMLASGQCSASCPELTFRAPNSTCQPCHFSCLQCDGASQSGCTACPAQFSLENGTCSLRTSCSSGQFFDRRTLECRFCHESCAECSGKESSECSACYAGFSLDKGGQCVFESHHSAARCGAAEFFDAVLQRCAGCHTSCSQCADAITCTACTEGAFLQSRRLGESVEEERLCVRDCPPGFYGDAASGSCQPCPPYCEACLGPASCTSCSLNASLPHEGRCPQPCPPAHFFNLTSEQCTPCAEHCALCRGAGCLRCALGHLLLPDHSSCVPSCPAHTVTNEQLAVCEDARCHPSCRTCYGRELDQCMSCPNGSILHENSCLESCPTHMFFNGSGCVHCQHVCASCSGPAATDCLSCPQGRLLDHFSCVETCPPGSFPAHHDDQPQCLACPAGCAACSGVAVCSSCVSPLLLMPLRHTCVETCPAGYAPEGRACLSCPAHCSACLSANSCQQCEATFVYYEPNRTCLRACPAGYYRSESRCLECLSPCSQCSGLDSCTSCRANHAMDTNTSLCRPCCSADARSKQLCCDCDRSPATCLLVTPPTQEVGHSGSGKEGKGRGVPVVVALMVTLVVLVVVSVGVGVWAYRRYRVPYLKFHRVAKDPLEVLYNDDEDSASEAEIFTRT